MSAIGKFRLGLLWHMHQPFYYNPDTNKFDMPWVRLHGLKDYLDMPLLASRYENIRVTFNLVPSMLDQIEMYCQGITDHHFDLSMIPARELDPLQKEEILRTFFSANYQSMIEPNVRYRQLYRKSESCGNDTELAVKIFSASEWRDLQVWSNMVWIDSMFHEEEPIRQLLEKGRDFTEEDKLILMNHQIDILKRIIPTYQKLYDEKRIDISFTPYYHPILPLLMDTDSSREALSDIKLPIHRFSYPEDAENQIKKSCEKYGSLFGGALSGMWPSEGSISEPVLKLMNSAGIKWTASDEEVLAASMHKSGLKTEPESTYHAYEYDGASGLKIFFRDRGLSDKIGFVYSTWSPEKALADFIQTVRQIKDVCKDGGDNNLIPIILDGENAWEYYPDDGYGFLTKLYEYFDSNDEFHICGFTDISENIIPIKIPRIFAGSWINHNFKIWIGHPEDNAAWDLLFMARKAIAEFEKNSDSDPEIVERAWNQIYIAEGSDWCWWYGDEHIGAQNDRFDILFRNHIRQIYNMLNIEVPPEVSQPIYRGRQESFLAMPESLITPVLDGYLTHYYEWSGAGRYECRKAGTAMHRSDTMISDIYFAFDYDQLYIRLDFENRFHLVDASEYKLILDFDQAGKYEIPLSGEKQNQDEIKFVYGRLLESSLSRKKLTSDGCGEIKMMVSLYLQDKLLEKWPADNPIKLDLPEKDKEIFWQV